MVAYPFVSLIMPVRNESAHIRQSLDSVLAQDYPQHRLEILIADGLSEDGTREIIAEYQKKVPNLRLIDNLAKIVPTGLNQALRIARGEIVIRIDGHCVIAPDYVRLCVVRLLESDAACVGGSLETVGETYIAEVIALAMSSPFGVGAGNFRTIKGQSRFVDTVAFPAYRRETIRAIGLFDEELVRNQDDEYNYRLRASGGKILLDSEIQSRYYSRAALPALWRQYFQYGFWKVRVLQKHPRQMRIRQFFPPGFVLGLLSLFGLALLKPSWGWLLIAAIVFYAAVSLTAAFVVAKRSGWRYLPALPLVYGILHMAYGLGFMVGLARFSLRWKDRYGQVPEDGIE